MKCILKNITNFLSALAEVLSKEYKARASLHSLPWLDTTRFQLDKVYTRLGIVQRQNTRSQLTDITVELSDIFDKHDYTMREHPRTVLATSRQEKGLKVRQYFDTLLEIEGYSESDVAGYVIRYFQDNESYLLKT